MEVYIISVIKINLNSIYYDIIIKNEMKVKEGLVCLLKKGKILF
jgi:hypothetical protein